MTKVPGYVAFTFALGLLGVSGDARAAAVDESFDRTAALNTLQGVDVSRCKAKKGPTGEGHVIVTFAPNGAVTGAVVDRAPFAGTRVGTCVAARFKKATVPAFKGDAVHVGKVFRLE